MNPLDRAPLAARPDPRNGGQSHPTRGGQGPVTGPDAGNWQDRDDWRDDQQDDGSQSLGGGWV